MRAVLAILFIVPAVSLAASLPHLRTVPEINSGLIDVQVADIIRHECPSIEGRVFKGLMYFRSLYDDAREMGYSHDEVKTFVDDPIEKQRVHDAAVSYIAEQGGTLENTQSLCRVGKAEIEQKSRIGSFLKAR